MRSDRQACATSVATVSVVIPGLRPPITTTRSLATLESAVPIVVGTSGNPSFIPTSLAFSLEACIATRSCSLCPRPSFLAASMYCLATDPPPTTMATLCPFFRTFSIIVA